MIQSTTAQHTKDYFDNALSTSDYYIHDQELPGTFHGKVAGRLQLDGQQATRLHFHSLCDNINPVTGKNLTPRTKDTRTVGYDINFHCPKSVSLLHCLNADNSVLDIFKESVNETMRLIERDMKSRVRVDGKNENRATGELLWAEFVHQTARPVGDHAPDPHLHAHCFAFNTTWDDQEKRFKAGQFRDIKRDMPYYQAVFHKKLADKLEEAGYTVRKTDKAFEVTIIPEQAIELFSKRTNEIGQVAKEKNITDLKELDQLGARTRSAKARGLSMNELKTDWRGQIKHAGMDGTEKETQSIGGIAGDAKTCIDHAVAHCFERVSVIQDRRILALAYHHALGNNGVTIKDMNTAFTKDGGLYKVTDAYQTLVTTQGVQREEKRMLDLAHKGRRAVTPLQLRPRGNYATLNTEQAKAVDHILTSPDRVTLIRGGAGTGKTTLTKTAVQEIEKTGKKVFLFAPTAEASRGVLKEEGFKDATTVESLLTNKTRHDDIKGQVIWIDEAGLLGTKAMADLLHLADKNGARVVLAGDTRQHTAVQRGDALRILQKMGGLRMTSVNRIYRQKQTDYRKAVEAIAKGDMADGFTRLDAMGAIRELKNDKLVDTLAGDYLETVNRRKMALVISPTNEQAQKVTTTIRAMLKDKGLIGAKDRTLTGLRNLYLTNAQKQDLHSYKPGQVVQFHQNMKGIKRGARLPVTAVEHGKVVLAGKAGQPLTLPTEAPDRFDVYTPGDIPLTKGDMIRITKNGFDKNRNRLDNGMLLQVQGFTRDGAIRAVNPKGTGKEYCIDKDYGNLAHAYCLTSYASQGKTVDRVFIAQPAATFPATSQKQFYVSVSRGKEAVTIYTDNKDDLLDHVGHSGDRLSATELVGQSGVIKQAQEINRLKQQPETRTKPSPDSDPKQPYHEREPEI